MTTQETPEPGTEDWPRTMEGGRLFTDNEPMDMLESNGVTWADVRAIEAEARAAVLAAIKKHVYSLRVEEHGPVDWARNGVLSDIVAFLDTDGLSDGGPTDG